MKLGDSFTLDAFLNAADGDTLGVNPTVADRLVSARKVVDAAAASETPVYGLNTGLGSNLGVPIASSEIAAHQRRIVEGRATAVGPPLPPGTGRMMLLARLISAAKGASGISPGLFAHLLALFNDGFDPPVPEFGSIGSSDLTQNAVWALPILDAPGAPALAPKDGLILISHSALTVTLAARALSQARTSFRALRHAALVSFTGYHGNPQIFGTAINDLRPAPGQAETAAWFRDHLAGTVYQPMRIQDALSYRTLAPCFGAAEAALTQAIAVWELEANGSSDSPAVIGETLVSTPNFQSPALAQALQAATLAMAQLACGSAERLARLMTAELSGLPKDLSTVGGASAGFVPAQKTAAALLAQAIATTTPRFEGAPIAHGVEDAAPMTPQAAEDLRRCGDCLLLIAGLEARAAVQAHQLRQVEVAGPELQSVLLPLLREFKVVTKDRPLGAEFERMALLLADGVG
ncbi:MAG: aromatic amino acid lyase [Pseudomonadota bacterium]